MYASFLKKPKSIILLVTAILLSVKVTAQKKMYEVPDEQNKFSASFTSNFGGFVNGDGGLGGGLAVQYQFKKTFVQIQFSGISELGIFDADYHDCLDFGLLYGIKERKRKWVFMAAGGISFYSYRFHENKGGGFLSFSNAPANYVTTTKNAVGFPVAGSIVYQPHKFGYGITTNTNINSAKTYVSGGLIVLYTFK